MKQQLLLTSLLCLLATPAAAQTTSSTGVGVGIAKSSSQSGAVAISGQGGSAQGGNSSLTVNNPATTTQNQNVSGTQTLRNVPTVFAPGLTAAGLETCLGSVSAGVGVVGTGVSFGTTVPDAGCAARLDARTLWSMGLKKAAVARLCITPEIARSMPEICGTYLPAPPGYAPAMASPFAQGDAYAGGPVEVVMRATGEHRICRDYDVTRERCRTGAGAHKKTAAVTHPTPKPKPAEAPAAAEHKEN